jgi:MarR family transcriptional regulator, organic hydroperoxide resistance regulator
MLSTIIQPMTVAADSRADVREAWGTLWQIMLTARAQFVAAMADLELTPAQGIVLRRLDPDRPTPMNELAEALACDASNVTGLVDRLEARGFVERRADPGDRRVRTLVLTADGIALRGEVIERMSQPPEAIARLSARDQRALRDILRRATGRSGS